MEPDIQRIGLRGGDLDVSILSFGATIEKLVVDTPRGPRHVVLGFDSAAAYRQHRVYMGCVVGRFANRIAAGRFALDGASYQLSRNENGNHLHGGFRGLLPQGCGRSSRWRNARRACRSYLPPARKDILAR